VPIEWPLILSLFALGSWLLEPRQKRAGLLIVAMLLSGALLGLNASAKAPAPPAPISVGRAGFVGSSACRSCHPQEYASWHASFHRRMTQSATLAAVANDRLRAGGRLSTEAGGRRLELFGRGDQLWASLPDPSVTSAVTSDAYERAFSTAPLRDVRVQLVTGSHHHQAFWVKATRAGELRALPAVYVVDEAMLLPRRDAFLNPPDAPEPNVRWNSNCVQCHAVAGAPGHDQRRDSFETSAAELGIACEACHGEGEAHARAMQNPLARYAARRAPGPPALTTNPEKLTRERASQVCGRCHSYFFPKQELDWWQHGFAESYEPGQDLARAQLLLSPEVLAAPGAPDLGIGAQSLFYADGTIRVGGREYNGLRSSPCFERGRGERQLSCLSCHSMHRGAPDDQLDPEKLGNRACAQCHEALSSNVAAHSRHATTSSGSLCYNCHMPHTSYALLGAIRSHRVDSPAFDSRTRDKPNACNLCHLERSEAWAAEQTAAWFGDRPAFRLDRQPGLDARETPAGAVFALAGDAAVRAITAAALGRHQSSRPAPELRDQLLELLTRDDYAAVRQIAQRSRRGLAPGSGAPPLSSATLQQLLAVRDRRPVTIAE
jgi:hypothetical protein